MEYDKNPVDDYVIEQHSEESGEYPRESWRPEDNDLYPGDSNRNDCESHTLTIQSMRRKWYCERLHVDPCVNPRDVPTFEELQAQLDELANSPTGRSLLDIALEAQRLSVYDVTSDSAQLARDKEDF